MIEGRPKNKRSLCRVLCASVMGTLLFSCGIDILSVLDSPPEYISPLVFKGPLNPDATLYRGIDIYYRIYAKEEDANADREKLLNRQAQANALPGDAIKFYLLSDLGLKYKRLNVNQGTPSLNKDYLGSYRVQLSYDQAAFELTLLRYDGLSPPIIIKRSNDGTSSFSVRPVEPDGDYQTSADDDSEPDRYHIQFFAASYGIDIANGSFNDLYSNAVSLGIQAIDY